MYGKPYHKMPVSSWMIPEGNRDQKRRLMREQKYPMKSAIQKNLGGPLSEVFFSCLTPAQQGHIGYTPTLKGPGRDLWVSPSDILRGKVVLTPPFTSRLRQALTHQGIMEMGAEIEARVHKKHQLEMEQALRAKEREMKKEVERMIKEAVEADRKAQQIINNQILEKASTDLSKSYQEVLASSVSQVLEEGLKRLEEAVEKTKREMEEELCLAVNSRSHYLCKQFDFQLMWRESELLEKYQNKLKKHRQNCSEAMDKAQREFEMELKKTMVQIRAEHITDMIIQGAERSEAYHQDKNQMEQGFEVWFIKYFDEEIVKRDFMIVELEDTLRSLQEKHKRREEQLEKVLQHFQKFINFALKEKPGQAEFLLSLQKELDKQQAKEKGEGEVEQIAKVILEYIIKIAEDTSKDRKAFHEKEELAESGYTDENFREKIQIEKEKVRLLRLVGEEHPTATSEASFIKSQIVSLVNMLSKNPSVVQVFSGMMSKRNVNIFDSKDKVC